MTGLPSCLSRTSKHCKDSKNKKLKANPTKSCSHTREPGIFKSCVRSSSRVFQRSLQARSRGEGGPPPRRPKVKTLAKHVVEKHGRSGRRGSGESAIRTGTWQHVPARLPRVKSRDWQRGASVANSWPLPFRGGLTAASQGQRS